MARWQDPDNPPIRFEKFVNEYLKHYDATKAAIDSGYSTTGESPRTKGHQLLKKPVIKALIKKHRQGLMKRAHITQDRICAEAAAIAFADPADLLDDNGKLITDVRKMPVGIRHAIESIKFDSDGNVTFCKLGPKGRMLEVMGRWAGLEDDNKSDHPSIQITLVDQTKSSQPIEAVLEERATRRLTYEPRGDGGEALTPVTEATRPLEKKARNGRGPTE